MRRTLAYAAAGAARIVCARSTPATAKSDKEISAQIAAIIRQVRTHRAVACRAG